MKPLLRPFLPAFLTLALSPLAFSQATFTWTGAVNHDWYLAANWDLPGSPSSTNDVFIPAGSAAILGGTALSGTINLGGGKKPAGLEIRGTGTSLLTVTPITGINVLSGTLGLKDGATLITQGVNIGGLTGESLVEVRGLVSGTPTQWANYGDFSLTTGGRFVVAEGAYAGSLSNTLISGGHASVIGEGRNRSTWHAGQLSVDNNPASSLPELEILNGGRVTSDGVSVSGTVTMNSTSTGPFGNRRSEWTSFATNLNSGGLIHLQGWSLHRTDTLAIRGGELLAEGGGTVRLLNLEVSEGGKLVLDGGNLLFRSAGVVLEGVDDAELIVGDNGATLAAYAMKEPLVIAGSLGGTGQVTFASKTSMELTKGSTYEGGTIVDRGLLLVNNTEGSATGSGDVVVNKGATLGGSGFIAGSVLSNGLVSPGNSPGTLHIGGDFTLTETGGMELEIESPQSFDVLKVDGKVTLGGSLFVRNPEGLEIGQQFDVIRAGGGFTGDFHNVGQQTDAWRRLRFVTSGNTGTVLVAPRDYHQMAMTWNEKQVASALDPWIHETEGDMRTVSENLDRLLPEEYRTAFNSLTPALHMAGVATSIEQSQGQMSAVNQHLNSRRLRPSVPDDTDKLWEAWVISTGAYSPGSMSSLAGDDYSAGNFIAGIERQVAPGITAGLFNSYGDSEGDFSGASKVEEERFTLGAHATAQYNGSYANTALGFGVLEMDVRRAIDFGNLSRRARSSTDGTEFFAMLSGGHDFREGNWIFGPSASLQYSNVRYQNVKESGAGALDLNIDNPEDDSLRSQLGGRVAYVHKASQHLTLIPEARVFWQHEYLRENDTIASQFAGTGTGFLHRPDDADGDSVFTGLGLGFQTDFGFYGNVSYDLEFGREDDVNHTLTVGADWKF